MFSAFLLDEEDPCLKCYNPPCRSEEATAHVINVDESSETAPQAIKAFCTALNAEER